MSFEDAEPKAMRHGPRRDVSDMPRDRLMARLTARVGSRIVLGVICPMQTTVDQYSECSSWPTVASTCPRTMRPREVHGSLADGRGGNH